MSKERRTNNIVTDRINDYHPHMTIAEAAYTAGIIDGEGSISILRVLKKDRKKQHYILSPKVYVSNTDVPLLRWLETRLEMKINSRIKRDKKYKNTPLPEVTIQLAGYRCYNLLKEIEPYLIVKKDKARLVMRFIESRQKDGTTRYNGAYTEEQIRIWQEVRALNRRESSPYPVEASLTIMSTT